MRSWCNSAVINSLAASKPRTAIIGNRGGGRRCAFGIEAARDYTAGTVVGWDDVANACAWTAGHARTAAGRLTANTVDTVSTVTTGSAVASLTIVEPAFARTPAESAGAVTLILPLAGCVALLGLVAAASAVAGVAFSTGVVLAGERARKRLAKLPVVATGFAGNAVGTATCTTWSAATAALTDTAEAAQAVLAEVAVATAGLLRVCIEASRAPRAALRAACVVTPELAKP